MLELSVVATLYQSAQYLEEFYQRMVAACEQHYRHFEIILVNDGSPDDSLLRAIQLHQQDPRVKVIDLSRNFGHHKAMMTGLGYAKGERVFLIDSDLEEPPELLLQFSELMAADARLDMVYGVQQDRKGDWFERWSGKLYYKLVNALVEAPIPENFLTVRLMSQRFVKQLCRYQERELNFATLIALTGFDSLAVTVAKGHKGSSSYTLTKKLRILVNTITSASSQPLWLIFILGLSITALSFIAIMYVLIRHLLFDISAQGWASLIVSIWFIGGVLILSVGTIGIYLSKIFIEVKHRPYTNIREIYQQEQERHDG